LRSYWQYEGCRYDKTSCTCSKPEHIATCPVPVPRLRNGRLNQTAFSLRLFIRDHADDDLVGWIDCQLEAAASTSGGDLRASHEALIGPLREIFGVRDKVLTMALSDLFIGARSVRPHWFEVGKSMIVVDSLVHNFLHRTGLLFGCGAPHAFGSACYKPGGCAEIIRKIAAEIDGCAFNPKFPKRFERWVQFAIWRFCAADGLNLCNGNRIADLAPCEVNFCYLYRKCQKISLKHQLFQ
jgi:hypothetical protein